MGLKTGKEGLKGGKWEVRKGGIGTPQIFYLD